MSQPSPNVSQKLQFALAAVFAVLFVTIVWQRLSSSTVPVTVSATVAYVEDEPTEPTEPTDLAIEAELIRERPPSVANLSTMMVPAHHHIQNVYLIAPKYHLATCQIQKNMATIRMATFCYLNHTMEFIATNQSISTVFWFDKQVSVSIRLQFLQDGTDMEGFGVIIGLALNLCWKSLNFNVGTEKGNMTNAQKGRLSGHKT
ncbi:unnamed protein product [Heligmosomoides polygyrus]|uniref:Secreted protein n=1 Tax=Heligmosomoides polygyrus TaxID=6339 RepID=A0A183FQX5_HELPZ|nr:unnamed protein product [Heligmosomoides polygyrus]